MTDVMGPFLTKRKASPHNVTVQTALCPHKYKPTVRFMIKMKLSSSIRRKGAASPTPPVPEHFAPPSHSQVCNNDPIVPPERLRIPTSLQLTDSLLRRKRVKHKLRLLDVKHSSGWHFFWGGSVCESFSQELKSAESCCSSWSNKSKFLSGILTLTRL